MDKRIVILALASFAMGTEAFVYAGHLTALARETGVSIASAGQLAAAFAITAAVSGPFIAGFVGRFERRSVITLGLGLIGLLNIAAAFQSSFEALIAIRILCGLAAGLVGPISSVAAAELVPPEQRGKAMALTLGGVTLAFVLGVPAGSVIGDFFGWRGTFAFAGIIALAVGFMTVIGLPRIAGKAANRRFTMADTFAPAVMASLVMTLIGFASAFTIVAYIGPLATAIAGLTGSGIGAVQALIGIGSIAGIVLGGRTADGPWAGPALVMSFGIAVLSAVSYSILLSLPGTAVTLGSVQAVPYLTLAVMTAGMVVGSSCLFTRIPIIQTRLANVARPEALPVIFALNGSMVFFGQGLGAVIGGAAIHWGGLTAIGVAAAAVGIIGLAVSLGNVSLDNQASVAVGADDEKDNPSRKTSALQMTASGHERA